MKILFEREDIEAVAEVVVERLKPLLGRNDNGRDEDIILDVVGLGKYLKVEESWIYDKVSSGVIPYFKAGKYLRFKKSGIDRWIERNTVKPTSPLDLVKIAK